MIVRSSQAVEVSHLFPLHSSVMPFPGATL